MCKEQNTFIHKKVNGQKLCASFQIPPFLSVCLYKNNLYPQSVSSIYRYWSFFIILSYSYLTLPEKQSSSAVTWASPGCHVFLKGCLRGTLQIEPLLITCSIHLCIPHFDFSHKLDLQSTFLTVKCSFIFIAFVAILSCCVVFLAIPACSNQLRCS